MLIKLSAGDLSKNRRLDPGWYEAEYFKFEATPAAAKPGKPQSTNFWAYFRILKDDREMRTNWNSQMIQLMEPFVVTITGQAAKTDPNDPKKVVEDINFEPESHYGKKIQVYVADEPYNGDLVSKITDFLPIGVTPPSVAF